MNFGPWEILIIILLVLILFGAKRLPELGRSLGQGIKEFKKSTKGVLDDDEDEKQRDKNLTESR